MTVEPPMGKVAAPTKCDGRPVSIVNLTPHEIRLVRPEGVLRIPPARQVACVAVRRIDAGRIDTGGVTITLWRTAYGEVEGLPDPAPNTLYVVSPLVAAAARERDDLLIPDDLILIRDEQGRVIGARGLVFPV